MAKDKSAKKYKPKPDPKEFGNVLANLSSNLKRLREEKGWTQEDMISKGIQLRQYQRLEQSVANPTLLTLARLAEIFDCTVTDLLNA